MPARKLQLLELQERERIGVTLRVLRETRGLTADQLAQAIDCSPSHLYNIEAGRKPLTEINLARLAVALQVPQFAIVRPGYYQRDAA